jgi:hypothetical protein
VKSTYSVWLDGLATRDCFHINTDKFVKRKHRIVSLWIKEKVPLLQHCQLREAYESVARRGSLSDAVSSNITRFMLRLFDNSISVIAGDFDKTWKLFETNLQRHIPWASAPIVIKLCIKIMTFKGYTLHAFLIKDVII